MVKFDLEPGPEVARRREVAYKEGALCRDFCIPYCMNNLHNIGMLSELSGILSMIMN